ncbi:HNH endonuclease [Promicromonospora panici]|uniref:HNH endonuclease n=1 Tax=Promicromonospora panici TaxID=2219658 RepID=UPI00101C756E|nr:HNH endonuclease signature motif containing protein [Promicromonospora panici]
MILPGGTDTASSVSKRVQAQWVDLLGELEAMKNTVTATQARLAVALEEATKADEARQGIRAGRRGRGVPNQVGAALQASPHTGASFLGTARVWVTQMPFTFDALRTGVLSAWRATLLVRETSHLSVEDRARIDEEICGPAGLAGLARMGTKRLIAKVKELAGQLDVRACVKRNAKAESERCVSVRPAPDLMVYLTALVPMRQGVQAYAQLKNLADAAKATGDERGAGQIMADTLIERITGREPGHADDVPVTINLLVSDQTLLAGGDEPAMVVEGTAAGVGTVPAPVARNLVAQGIDAEAAWLRAVYVDPHGRLLATTSTSRFHPQGLARLLRAREQGVCASSWCDAPVRHIDHITPHAEGGATSLDNGQGLCARCNHAKQSPGWSQQVTEIDGRHAVETVMPTGHTSVFVAPAPPRPVTDAAKGHEHAGQEYAGQEHTSAARLPDPVRAETQDGAGQSTPPWTPAVGVKGPAPGRVPRSRYSIGCSVPRPPGAIAYRPPGRREQVGPGRRPRSRPDLAWAHPPGAHTR